MPTTASTPCHTSAAAGQDPIARHVPQPPAAQPPDLPACDACAAPVPSDDLVPTLAGTRICPPCQHEDYRQCPDCGGWNPDGYPCGNGCDDDTDEDDDDTDEDDDDTDEDDDDDEQDDDDGGELIQDYGFKPYPVFHGTGPLFLGLELELATPYGRWEPAYLAVQTLDSLGYLKADDSIGGGFELVTHPMTYPWALAHFPWTLLPDLADAGCQATDRCGLHVHLSRAGFASPAHVYRWMTFVFRNQTPVTALARRASDSWARFDDDDRGRVKDYAKGALGLYRYRAINTQNTDTFELRIFASTLQPVQVQAALAFAAATVDYTRSLTVAAITRDHGWSWPAFTGWLATRPVYAPLLDQVQALTTGGASCVC